MANESQNQPKNETQEFARQSEQKSVGLMREFLDFMRENKAWWMAPILVVLLLVGVIVFLGTTAAAPLIYTLW